MKKKPVEVKELIEKAISKSNKLRENVIKTSWKDIVGGVSKNSAPLFIRNETLEVVVEGGVYLQHITFKKGEYLKKIEFLLNGPYIKDIRGRIGKVPKVSYEEEKEIPYEIIGETYNDTPTLKKEARYLSKKEREELLENIGGEEIRERIENIMTYSIERDRELEKKGYKRCEVCGQITLLSICNQCRINQEEGIKNKVYKILERDPYIAFEEVCKSIDGFTMRKFLELKDKKMRNTYKESQLLVRNDKVEEARKLFSLYFKLETGERDEENLKRKIENQIRELKKKFK